MSEGHCRYKVVGNQRLIFDDQGNLIGASGLPAEKNMKEFVGNNK